MQPVATGQHRRARCLQAAIKRVGRPLVLIMGHLWSDGLGVVDVTNTADPNYLKSKSGTEYLDNQVTFHDNSDHRIAGQGASMGRRGRQAGRDGILIVTSANREWKKCALAEPGSTGTPAIPIPAANTRNSVGRPARISPANILIIMAVSDRASQGNRAWAHARAEGRRDGAAKAHRDSTGRPMSAPWQDDLRPVHAGCGQSRHQRSGNQKLSARVTFSPPSPAPASSRPTVLPMWDRNLCSHRGGEQLALRRALTSPGLLDNKDPKNPRRMSLFPLPQAPEGRRSRIREKAGRF